MVDSCTSGPGVVQLQLGAGSAAYAAACQASCQRRLPGGPGGSWLEQQQQQQQQEEEEEKEDALVALSAALCGSGRRCSSSSAKGGAVQLFSRTRAGAEHVQQTWVRLRASPWHCFWDQSALRQQLLLLQQ
jgi:hypothetical protein